jgi:hypothetical protein
LSPRTTNNPSHTTTTPPPARWLRSQAAASPAGVCERFPPTVVTPAAVTLVQLRPDAQLLRPGTRAIGFSRGPGHGWPQTKPNGTPPPHPPCTAG